MCGKTAVQTKRDKQRLIDRVPVRKAALVVSHRRGWCPQTGTLLRNPRGRPPQRRLRARLPAPHFMTQ